MNGLPTNKFWRMRKSEIRNGFGSTVSETCTTTTTAMESVKMGESIIYFTQGYFNLV